MAEQVDYNQAKEDIGRIRRLLVVFENAESALSVAESSKALVADCQRESDQLKAQIAELSEALKNLTSELAITTVKLDDRNRELAQVQDRINAETADQSKARAEFLAEMETARSKAHQELREYREGQLNDINAEVAARRREGSADMANIQAEYEVEEERLAKIKRAIRDAAKASAEAAQGL